METAELTGLQVSEKLGSISESMGALKLKIRMNVLLAEMAMNLHSGKTNDYFHGYQKAINEIARFLDELN